MKISRIELVRHIGMDCWREIQRGTSRTEALQKIGEQYMERYAWQFDGTPAAEFFHDFMTYTPTFGLSWLQSAFSVIEPTDRLAASLMCTRVDGGNHFDDLQMPWSTFAIKVPARLFGSIENLNEEEKTNLHSLDRFVLVSRSSHGEFSKMVFDSGPGEAAWANVGRVPALSSWFDTNDCEMIMDGVRWYREDGTQEPFDTKNHAHRLEQDYFKRTSTLENRLILGVLIELDSPLGDVARGRCPRHPKRTLNRHGDPVSWTFQLARNVTLDLRQAVSDFGSGRRSSVNVQILVRGHHKRQAHGSAKMLRKWVHIQPYWRGPNDAPIALRGHRFDSV